MKNILLATDLATQTNRAFERAIQLASTLSAKCHILHVCPLYFLPSKKKQTISLKQDAETMIKNTLAGYKEAKELKTSITVIEGGETFAEIIHHAEKVRAGLIVMGMHGKVKLRDMFVGTTIERVIRKGIKPVLMVRDSPVGGYKKVLVGTDFSAGSKQAFLLALELAPKSTFDLVHCYGFPNIYMGDHMAQHAEDVIADLASDRLERFVKQHKRVLKKYNVTPQKFNFGMVRGDTFSSLTNKASNLKADLIAIGTYSNVSLMPYKLGGTAKDILTNPPCDVLVAKGL